MSASIQGNGIINNQPIYMNIPITNVTVGPAPSSLVTVFFTLPSIPPYTTITNATIYSGTGLSNSLTSISSQSSSITLSGLAGNITYNGFYLVFTYSTGVIMQTQTFSVTTGSWNISSLTQQNGYYRGGLCCNYDGSVVWLADNVSNSILYSSNYGANFTVAFNNLSTAYGGVYSYDLNCDNSGQTLWLSANFYSYKGVRNTNGTFSLTNLSTTLSLGLCSAICANPDTNRIVITTIGGQQGIYSSTNTTYGYWLSTNYGTNFSFIKNPNVYANGNYGCNGIGSITMNSTGQYIAMAGCYYQTQGSSQLYSFLLVSTDYGSNFNVASSNAPNFPSPTSTTTQWAAVKYNYNGSLLIASLIYNYGASTGSIFSSVDNGTTWTALLSVSPNNWGTIFNCLKSICVDTTGTKIVMGTFANGSPLYSYNNGTLVSVDPSSSSFTCPGGVVSDVSGSKYIYVFQDSTALVSSVRYYK